MRTSLSKIQVYTAFHLSLLPSVTYSAYNSSKKYSLTNLRSDGTELGMPDSKKVKREFPERREPQSKNWGWPLFIKWRSISGVGVEYLRSRCGWRGIRESHHEGIYLLWLVQTLFDRMYIVIVFQVINICLGIFAISALIYCTHDSFLIPVR